jgi:hypothetical protein
MNRRYRVSALSRGLDDTQVLDASVKMRRQGRVVLVITTHDD